MVDLLNNDDFDPIPIEILSTKKLITLSILSIGLYPLWWQYKTWRYFKEKDMLDIMPVARAIFALFFLFGLFERVQDFSKSKGSTYSFNSFVCFLGFIAMNLLAYLPDNYFLISLLSCVFLVPPLKSLNEGIKLSGNYAVIENQSFSGRQSILLVIGALFWFLMIIGMLVPIE